jgi:hypothetical protein
MTRHGPNGSISIAFETGSVVVPGTSETIAAFCPDSEFISDDFPAFLLPKKAILTRSAFGVSFNPAMFFPHSSKLF